MCIPTYKAKSPKVHVPLRSMFASLVRSIYVIRDTLRSKHCYEVDVQNKHFSLEWTRHFNKKYIIEFIPVAFHIS